VYCELKKILSGVRLHDRTLGFEVDVMLSEHHIGIEIDGWYWHKDKVEWDRQKSSAMIAAGVTPIRLRGNPLPGIGLHDIRFKKEPDQRVVVQQLVQALEKLAGIDLHYDPTHWVNDAEYQKAVLRHG
jgi:very-short-patch-repair endonuclease